MTIRSNLLTTTETARRARCSPRFLQYQWKVGLGPRRTWIGRKSFVVSADLDAWLRSCAEPRRVGHQPRTEGAAA